MKKILINGTFLVEKITGVQRYAIDIISEVDRLYKDKYEFIIAVPNVVIENDYGFNILYDNVKLNRILWQQIRLPIIAKSINADILWSPCNIGPVFVGIPHIINMYDASVFEGGIKWFNWKFVIYYKLMFKLLGRLSSYILVCSNFSKKELIKHNISTSEKLKVVYAAVSKKFLFNKFNPNKEYYVLSVGSRDPRKNIASLLKAWNILPKNLRSNFKLLIVGSKSKSFREEFYNKHLDYYNVLFKGYVKDDELIDLYRNAMLFVYPSFYEGFGIPPLEAMACGCPCVVSNAASLPEVCGDAAYYVNPYDIEDIARGIEKVLTDENLRQELVKKGFENVKRFSWEKSAQEIIQILQTL